MSSVEDVFTLVVGAVTVAAVGFIWFLLKGSGPKPIRPKTEERSPTSKSKRKKNKKGGDNIVFFEEEEAQPTGKKQVHREASDGMVSESLSGLTVVSLKAGGATTTKKTKGKKQVVMPTAEQIDKDLNKGFVCIKKSAGATVRGQIDEEVEETPQKKSPKGKGTEEKKQKPWERELPIFKKEEAGNDEDDKNLSEQQKIRKMIEKKRDDQVKKAAEKEKISGKVLKPGKKKSSSLIGGSGQESPRESQKPWGENAGASSSSSHLPDSHYPSLGGK